MANFNVGDKVLIISGEYKGAVMTIAGFDEPLNHFGEYSTYTIASFKEGGGCFVYRLQMMKAAKPGVYQTGRAARATAPVNKTVLKHLKARGSISPMEAIITYGVMRLAPAIHDLRAAGHNITTEMREDAKGHKYASYQLAA